VRRAALAALLALGASFAALDSAVADADADAGATAAPERLADHPPPEERSAKPAPDEWPRARAVELERALADCRAHRIREWLRIRCRVETTGVELVGGSADGVEFREARSAGETEIILPLRRGDRRLIQLLTWNGGGKYTVEQDAFAVVSEIWLPGDRGPVVLMH
jgi:hypothetical protein